MLCRQETLDDGTLVENSFIDAMETLCVIWFTTEYFLRLFACPDKLEFLRDKGPFAYDVTELEINDLV